MDSSTECVGGVDWACACHAVAVVDHHGRLVDEFDVANTGPDLRSMCRRLRKCHVSRVAIERPDGPVVEALLAGGFQVVVIPPRSMKSLRERYSTAGNKSDRSDAFVLADSLRTDGHRWRPLEPDQPITVRLRSLVRARQQLVETRIKTANQLRAHLDVNFPAATQLFADIDAPTSLRFLEDFPTPTQARTLTVDRMQTWLKQHHYPRPSRASAMVDLLHEAGPESSATDPDGTVTRVLVDVLHTLRSRIDELQQHITAVLSEHPDEHIFRSLPRAGTLRAATLIAEIGDCRARFPDADSLAAHAGVAPSTRASGKYCKVEFRFGADHRLRDALCNFAVDTRRENQWAAQRYEQLRAAGKHHNHAARILARSWTTIIWRCWQDRVPYDPTRHTNHTTCT
jgi:transposase